MHREVWYEAHRCPRDTSKIKDNSSEDNHLKKRWNSERWNSGMGEAKRMQTCLGRFRATCGYIGPTGLLGYSEQPTRSRIWHRARQHGKYISQSFKLNIGTKTLKRLDHGKTFLDTHIKIPPDSHIYASKAIVWTKFPSQEQLRKWYACFCSLCIISFLLFNVTSNM